MTRGWDWTAAGHLFLCPRVVAGHADPRLVRRTITSRAERL